MPKRDTDPSEAIPSLANPFSGPSAERDGHGICRGDGVTGALLCASTRATKLVARCVQSAALRLWKA